MPAQPAVCQGFQVKPLNFGWFKAQLCLRLAPKLICILSYLERSQGIASFLFDHDLSHVPDFSISRAYFVF